MISVFEAHKYTIIQRILCYFVNAFDIFSLIAFQISCYFISITTVFNNCFIILSINEYSFSKN